VEKIYLLNPLSLSVPLKGERRAVSFMVETMEKNHGWGGNRSLDIQVTVKHLTHYTMRIS
jgi:hypothetical protein